MADFMISNKRDETFTKMSKGQQFLIEEVQKCKITVPDRIAALTVDFAKSSNITTGPIESSAFIRNCEDCIFVIACLQFRTRECKRCTFFLYSSTEPIIELSRGLQIGCYNYYYDKLREDMNESRLKLWNNKWSEVYDFTPPQGVSNSDGGGNWTALDMTVPVVFEEEIDVAIHDVAADDDAVVFSVGDEVKSVYGEGVVTEERGDDMFVVALSSWHLANESKVTCYLNGDALRRAKSSAASASETKSTQVTTTRRKTVVPLTVGKKFQSSNPIGLFILCFPTANFDDIHIELMAWHERSGKEQNFIVRTREFGMNSKQANQLVTSAKGKCAAGVYLGMEFSLATEDAKADLLATLGGGDWSCEGIEEVKECGSLFFDTWKEAQ